MELPNSVVNNHKEQVCLSSFYVPINLFQICAWGHASPLIYCSHIKAPKCSTSKTIFWSELAAGPKGWVKPQRSWECTGWHGAAVPCLGKTLHQEFLALSWNIPNLFWASHLAPPFYNLWTIYPRLVKFHFPPHSIPAPVADGVCSAQLWFIQHHPNQHWGSSSLVQEEDLHWLSAPASITKFTSANSAVNSSSVNCWSSSGSQAAQLHLVEQI